MNASKQAQSCALPPAPGPARQQLGALLREAEWPGDVDAVVLAVHEAIMNSMRHAGGARWVTADLDGWHLMVEVCDAGPGFDVDRHARHRPDATAERGRGLWLISQIADSWDVRHEPGDTCLTLRFLP